MKCFFRFSLLMIFISLLSCSKQNNRLIVHEIFISKHFIGPKLQRIVFVPPPGVKIPRGVNLEPNNTFDFCESQDTIDNAVYHPNFIFRINKTGRIDGYMKDCDTQKKGYFSLLLSDSMITYINNQMLRTNYNNLDTLYAGYGEGFTEYFISIKNNDDEKQIMIMQDYEGTKIIRNFVDSLYKYANTLELSDTLNISFRKDTLIVLNTEKYWDSPYHH